MVGVIVAIKQAHKDTGGRFTSNTRKKADNSKVYSIHKHNSTAKNKVE